MIERKMIPVVGEINEHCGSCIGACCRAGMILSMSDSEREFMESLGAQLGETGLLTRAEEIERARRILGVLPPNAHIISLAPEHPSYALLEDCPNLVELQVGGVAVCSIWDSPQKPAVCTRFEAGNPRCDDAVEAYYINITLI